MSSPLHDLSNRRLSVLICLRATVSLSLCFCTSFSAAPLRIASLMLLLRWGWVFLERTQILSGIQPEFTTHFIEFFVVETKQFVGSSEFCERDQVLTRQTCGQRSSRAAAESKRRALEKYFSERTCYMFLKLKSTEY